MGSKSSEKRAKYGTHSIDISGPVFLFTHPRAMERQPLSNRFVRLIPRHVLSRIYLLMIYTSLGRTKRKYGPA